MKSTEGDKTIPEFNEYEVHPRKIMRKKQLLAELPSIFSDKKANTEKEKEDLEAELYRQIGQLKVELEWLKKKSILLGGGKA